MGHTPPVEIGLWAGRGIWLLLSLGVALTLTLSCLTARRGAVDRAYPGGEEFAADRAGLLRLAPLRDEQAPDIRRR